LSALLCDLFQHIRSSSAQNKAPAISSKGKYGCTAEPARRPGNDNRSPSPGTAINEGSSE
jgi:hypothetical protein